MAPSQRGSRGKTLHGVVPPGYHRRRPAATLSGRASRSPLFHARARRATPAPCASPTRRPRSSASLPPHPPWCPPMPLPPRPWVHPVRQVGRLLGDRLCPFFAAPPPVCVGRRAPLDDRPAGRPTPAGCHDGVGAVAHPCGAPPPRRCGCRIRRVGAQWCLAASGASARVLARRWPSPHGGRGRSAHMRLAQRVGIPALRV
ncbi:hypothetical protein BU14_1952s0002 [Porphyra umbilicalis]|uniref:Uncharacterized protein n=1 Tax=Porphyra umbilicalis TaxID=2786 RepID=A0A1X6NK91_PORUM|nr:hypothetical protein BU14_1952s0002 [Porphyra umbilicalis]|eukprot:OSX69024.1 hypothetical protein BU14_1952s0002 [Porphyra umbilicalis]